MNVTKKMLEKYLDDAEKERDLYMLALYDLTVGKIDITLNKRDENNELHKVCFSRLHINGIVLDINTDSHSIAVYDFVECETVLAVGRSHLAVGRSHLPEYLAEAIYQAKTKRAAILAPLKATA